MPQPDAEAFVEFFELDAELETEIQGVQSTIALSSLDVHILHGFAPSAYVREEGLARAEASLAGAKARLPAIHEARYGLRKDAHERFMGKLVVARLASRQRGGFPISDTFWRSRVQGQISELPWRDRHDISSGFGLIRARTAVHTPRELARMNNDHNIAMFTDSSQDYRKKSVGPLVRVEFLD